MSKYTELSTSQFTVTCRDQPERGILLLVFVFAKLGSSLFASGALSFVVVSVFVLVSVFVFVFVF